MYLLRDIYDLLDGIVIEGSKKHSGKFYDAIYKADYQKALELCSNDIVLKALLKKAIELNTSKQYKNDNIVYDYNQSTSHHNKFLDISTNYDPGLDSKGESSVERSLSIKSNELRNFSFSPEKKKKSGNSQRVSTLNSSFNGNKSSTSLTKIANIGVISEDEEYKINNRAKMKNYKKIKFYQNAEKKVTINLSMSTKTSKANTNNSASKTKTKKK